MENRYFFSGTALFAALTITAIALIKEAGVVSGVVFCGGVFVLAVAIIVIPRRIRRWRNERKQDTYYFPKL